MEELGGLAKEILSVAERVAEEAKSLQRQRDFIDHVSRALRRDPPNYSALQKLLKFPAREELAQRFPEAEEALETLERATAEAWREVSLRVLGRFRSLAKDSGFEVEGQPPKLTVGRGIEVAFQPNENKSIVNG